MGQLTHLEILMLSLLGFAEGYPGGSSKHEDQHSYVGRSLRAI